MYENKFFLFDIDGTLLHVQSRFMMQLIEQLIKKVGRDQIVMDSESFAGRTDKDIFLKLLHLNQLQESRFDELRRLYISHLDTHLTQQEVNSIRGVKSTLSYFESRQLHMGLLTGNFRESAFIKLNRAGLDSYFDFGAFGCNHTNRNDLPEIAYEFAKTKFGTSFKPSDLVIIGDTPKDIECAKRFGAISIAVSTGNFSTEELSIYEPCLLLDSLRNPTNWLSKLS